MTDNSWNEGAKWAAKLQIVLGNDYAIEYDSCESGLTRCYYKGQLYKTVENLAMNSKINIVDYRYINTNWYMDILSK